MKALVKAKAEEGIWLEDIPEPEIGPNDVLVKANSRRVHVFRCSRRFISSPFFNAISTSR